MPLIQKELTNTGKWTGRLLSLGRMVKRDILHSEIVLYSVFFARFFYFCKLKKSLRTLDSPSAFPVTISHNLRSLSKPLNRMALLIEPLSVLEQVGNNSRILVIGPRNEWDIFQLVRSGFRFDRCTGLDLISYSPSVRLGDMHNIPFEDEEFDVVLCGWTLSYSAHPQKACDEISRVCRKGGLIGMAVEYFSGDEEDERVSTGGYTIQDERLAERINSVDQILSLFPDRGDVYFSHDAPLRRSAPKHESRSNVATIFTNNPQP